MALKKRGRKRIAYANKKKLVAAYLDDKEKKLIIDKHGSLTNAVHLKILAELQRPVLQTA